MVEEIKRKRTVIKKETILYCDLCGKEIVELNDYKFNRAGIYYSEGEVYPDGRLVSTTCFDICVDCMKETVFPKLKKDLNIESREESILD